MKTKIKFSVLIGNKSKQIFVTYECPDFEPIDEPITYSNGSDIVNTTWHKSIEDQIDEWIVNLDKRDFMHQRGISIINNWVIINYVNKNETSIVTKETKFSDKDMITLFLHQRNLDEGIVADFWAVYNKMSESFKGIKWIKQIDLTMSGMSVAYKSSSNTLERIMGDIEKDLEEVKKLC